MPYDSIKVVRNELRKIVFATVTRLIVDNVHLINHNEQGDERIYSHFCGFAVTDKGESIWFKKGTFRPLFIAGVSHSPPLDMYTHYPQNGNLLAGQVHETEKGKTFTFWSHHADPIREFCIAIEAGPRSIHSSGRSFSKLRTVHTRGRTEDDLWLLARLYLLKDLDPFRREYIPEEGLMKHPVRQEGIRIERNVLEFVFFAAYFARDPSILKDFYASMQGFMPTASAKYSVPTLEALIERDTMRVETNGFSHR